MSDVSFLRFLNMSVPGVQSELLLLISDLELVERRWDARLDVSSSVSSRQSIGSFEADRALQVRRYRPIFRPYYKPDLSAFDPFYYQLELFPL